MFSFRLERSYTVTLGLVSLRRLVLWLAAVSVACFSLFGVAGCSSQKELPASVRSQKRLLLIAADRSGSMVEDDLKQARTTLMSIVNAGIKQDLNQETWIFTYGKTVKDKFGPVKITNRRQVRPVVADFVVGGDPEVGKGTYYAPVLDKFRQIAKERSDTEVYGLLLTDGDSHDDKSAKKAAAELAKVSNFRAMLIGPVSKEGTLRNEIREIFSADTKKFIIGSEGEMPARRQELEEKVLQ
jgi:hypothetical protein